jgi:hypothetical protein
MVKIAPSFNACSSALSDGQADAIMRISHRRGVRDPERVAMPHKVATFALMRGRPHAQKSRRLKKSADRQSVVWRTLSEMGLSWPAHNALPTPTVRAIVAGGLPWKEKRVIGKVMRRLIPFLILCYFVLF